MVSHYPKYLLIFKAVLHWPTEDKTRDSHIAIFRQGMNSSLWFFIFHFKQSYGLCNSFDCSKGLYQRILSGLRNLLNRLTNDQRIHAHDEEIVVNVLKNRIGLLSIDFSLNFLHIFYYSIAVEEVCSRHTLGFFDDV